MPRETKLHPPKTRRSRNRLEHQEYRRHTMNIGSRIIEEIIKQGMVQVAEPDPGKDHLFVWKANAADQLDALVAQHTNSYIEGQNGKRLSYLEKLQKKDMKFSGCETYLVLALDGTTCWGLTLAQAIDAAMQHDGQF